MHRSAARALLWSSKPKDAFTLAFRQTASRSVCGSVQLARQVICCTTRNLSAQLCFARAVGHKVRGTWQHWRRVAVIGGVSSAFLIAGLSNVVAHCKEKVLFTPLKCLEDRFVIQQELGRGGQAVVYKAFDKKSKRLVAIKVTNKSHPEGRQLVLAEMDLMTTMGRHHNLTSMQEACETSGSWILVMDLADGGALFERIVEHGQLTEALASDYILQVAEGLMHMHRSKLVHGDVKPENLLLCTASSDADASIKLCDFGMARSCAEGQGFAFGYTCGTFDYWAPEVVRQEPCTQAIDMWALGVVAYIMMCGFNPFDPTFSASDAEILSNIAHGKMDTTSEAWQHLSLECRDLIMGLLCPDVSKRLTASQVLQHPWVVNQQATAALPASQNQRLLGFQALTKLRAAVEKLNLNADALFDAVARKGAEELTTAELNKVFDLIGVSLSPQALRAVEEIGDIDQDGYIQRGEFVQMLRLRAQSDRDKALSDKDILSLFRIFDQNNDGKIVTEELVNVFGLLGRKLEHSKAQALIRQATQGSTDSLSLQQFTKLLKQQGTLFSDDE